MLRKVTIPWATLPASTRSVLCITASHLPAAPTRPTASCHPFKVPHQQVVGQRHKGVVNLGHHHLLRHAQRGLEIVKVQRAAGGRGVGLGQTDVKAAGLVMGPARRAPCCYSLASPTCSATTAAAVTQQQWACSPTHSQAQAQPPVSLVKGDEGHLRALVTRQQVQALLDGGAHLGQGAWPPWGNVMSGPRQLGQGARPESVEVTRHRLPAIRPCGRCNSTARWRPCCACYAPNSHPAFTPQTVHSLTAPSMPEAAAAKETSMTKTYVGGMGARTCSSGGAGA